MKEIKIQRNNCIYQIDQQVEDLRIKQGHETLAPLWLKNLDDPYAVCLYTHKDENHMYYHMYLTEKGLKALAN